MFRQPIIWQELDRLRRDMDRLFETGSPRWQRTRSSAFPAVNMWTKDDDGVIITAELPGVAPDDLELSVTGDTLTLSGKRMRGDDENNQYHRQERVFGSFTRTIQLPYSINQEKVEASLQNGLLKLTLPRAEAEKPKQIAIHAN
jgi:HSP20 family protein